MELGPRARLAFTATYLSVQAILIASGGRRPDHAFAFQMFSESCTARLTLLREVDAPSGHGTLLVPAPHGQWSALDAEGVRHSFDFEDRVKETALSTFDVTFDAPYGQDAEVARMQAAIDDVASHLGRDVETRRLVVDVTFRRNGREPHVVRLPSLLRPATRRAETATR